MRPLLPRFSLFALLASLTLSSGCGSLFAKGPQSLVDMDIWSEDCHPYTFPPGLKTITPESPNNAVMDPKTAPTLAVIRSTNCGNSLRVVQLVPSGNPSADPAGQGIRQGYALKDVSPLVAVEMMRAAATKK